MRLSAASIAIAVTCAFLIGCSPSVVEDTPLAGVIQTTTASDSQGTASPQSVDGADNASEALRTTRILSGDVYGVDNYQLFNLGPAYAGETVKVLRSSTSSQWFVAVLFDADYNLLYRRVLSSNSSFTHVLREDTEALYVAVAPSSSSSGGPFELKVSWPGDAGVPAPAQQVVYLNFNGGQNIDVNYLDGLSFAAFDASFCGDAYAGETQYFKDFILESMQRDYADYNVVILTSDDGPAPSTAHSVVHFGAEASGLLGLADSVDQYNSDRQQEAIVFVNTFAMYARMQLTPEEMAQMIANTGSHELGHLLGLFHTHNPDEIMDTTASASEMTEDQAFARSPLYDGVFPFGYEDTAGLLEQIVGLRPGGSLQFAKTSSLISKSLDLTYARKLIGKELHSRCGICAHPDLE